VVTIVPIAPFAKSRMPATCVGVLTWIFSPTFGLLVMVRSRNDMRAEPETRRIGPISEIRAVR
jgi:hypothetical protein